MEERSEVPATLERSGEVAGMEAAAAAGPPARVPLWEVESELARAYDVLEANDGAHDPEAEALVVSAIQAAEVKRDNVARFLRTVDAYEGHIEEEIGALKVKLQRVTAIRKRLLSYVGAVMSAFGVRELRGKAYGFKIVRNPPRVVVDDMTKLPERFIREKVYREPKLDELRAALKAGEILEGVHIEQGERVEVR